MRILSLYCREVEFTAIQKSGAASSVDGPSGIPITWANCLLLLATVEPDDESKVVAAAKAVRRIRQRVGAGTIVVNGFAHLSHIVAEPTASEGVLQRLATALREQDMGEVHLTQFGWHKEIRMTVRGEPGAQAFVHV